MFELDEVYTLTEADWAAFKAPRGKSEAALKGLAIDAYVKRVMQAEGATIPEDQYGPVDFFYDGAGWDTKSTTRGSISISERELRYAEDVVLKGGRMRYIIFEQSDSNDFTYRGWIDVATLLYDEQIRESQYSGYYFTLNGVGKLLKE